MRILTMSIVLAIGIITYGVPAAQNPIEVGDVQWGRDFDAAAERSAEEGKPVLVLFQEVSG